jgi:hypothetical protein
MKIKQLPLILAFTAWLAIGPIGATTAHAQHGRGHHGGRSYGRGYGFYRPRSYGYGYGNGYGYGSWYVPPVYPYGYYGGAPYGGSWGYGYPYGYGRSYGSRFYHNGRGRGFSSHGWHHR